MHLFIFLLGMLLGGGLVYVWPKAVVEEEEKEPVEVPPFPGLEAYVNVLRNRLPTVPWSVELRHVHHAYEGVRISEEREIQIWSRVIGLIHPKSPEELDKIFTETGTLMQLLDKQARRRL